MTFTLVTGGAASGKSAFAEGLVAASGRPRIYLATAQALDDEMRAKRDRHRAQRGDGWETVETALNAADALAAAPGGHAVLLDCATLWLSNHMMAGSDLEAEQSALIAALTACRAEVTVVTNEIGLGIVPADAGTRRFREAHGRMNIALAAAASRVALVACGLPMWLKGAP